MLSRSSKSFFTDWECLGQLQSNLLNTQYLFSEGEDIYKALNFDWYVDRIFQTLPLMVL